MARWRFNKRVIAWAIALGSLAIVLGVFLIDATQGEFLAEGFFLIVISWVLLLLVIAKAVQRVRRWRSDDLEEKE